MRDFFDKECDCRCHQEGLYVKHCVPCCHTCSHCKRRIKSFAIDQHEEKCMKKFNDFLEKFAKSMVDNKP